MSLAPADLYIYTDADPAAAGPLIYSRYNWNYLPVMSGKSSEAQPSHTSEGLEASEKHFKFTLSLFCICEDPGYVGPIISSSYFGFAVVKLLHFFTLFIAESYVCLL